MLCSVKVKLSVQAMKAVGSGELLALGILPMEQAPAIPID